MLLLPRVQWKTVSVFCMIDERKAEKVCFGTDFFSYIIAFFCHGRNGEQTDEMKFT